MFQRHLSGQKLSARGTVFDNRWGAMGADTPDPRDKKRDDEQPREDDEAPETPLDEPRPTPVQDPPPQPGRKGPYVVRRHEVKARRKGDFEENGGGAVTTAERKERRGFASMSPEKQREIASKGGRAAHEKGTAHEWTADEARSAGRKGGQVSRGGRGRLIIPPEQSGTPDQSISTDRSGASRAE